jgi:hypothetical protein
MVTPRAFIAGVGVVAVLIAAFLLFVPFSADGVSCGNAVSVDTSRAAGVDKFERIRGNDSTLLASCTGSASTRRTSGFVLGGIGAVAAAGALLVRVPSTR